MATIKVENEDAPTTRGLATMADVGDEGLMEWTCVCGARSDQPRPPWDAINDAEVHVDLWCCR
jgi:hypothetical protein